MVLNKKNSIKKCKTSLKERMLTTALHALFSCVLLALGVCVGDGSQLPPLSCGSHFGTQEFP